MSKTPPGSPPLRTRRVVAVAAAVQATGALPMFLTGALGVQIQEDLGFGPTALGVATGAFVFARACSSVRLGRLADNFGATRSMQLSAIGCGIAALAVALVARNWAMLVACMLFAGVVQAITQPAANRFVARAVPSARLGLAFGMKQSGPPVATLLAGLAVPALALTAGWRWGFGAAAVLAALTLIAIPRRSRQPKPPEPKDRKSSGGTGLALVMVGMGFSLAAINSMHTFIVPSGVDVGLLPALAGLILSIGSLLAVAARLWAGMRADRRGGGHFRFVARMLLVGAVGYLLLASAQPALFVAGAGLAYAATWGQNGVLFLAIVRHNPGNPAAASGATIAAGSIGGFCGPPLFGFVVQMLGYPAAWLMAAGWAGIAALAMTRSRAAQEDPLPPSLMTDQRQVP